MFPGGIRTRELGLCSIKLLFIYASVLARLFKTTFPVARRVPGGWIIKAFTLTVALLGIAHFDVAKRRAVRALFSQGRQVSTKPPVLHGCSVVCLDGILHFV